VLDELCLGMSCSTVACEFDVKESAVYIKNSALHKRIHKRKVMRGHLATVYEQTLAGI
jgi:hypothetical protein